MKKRLFFTLFVLTGVMVQAQYTAIPDSNFEAALDALGYDDIPGDNQVPTANISSVTILDVNNQNIADLTGIEDFTALQVLNCGSNQLTGLDVSQNTNLINLWCANNQLSNLDVSQNTGLTFLSCANNQLNSLDVSQNTALVTLSCYGNQLSSLDVSQNTNLTSLACANNPLGNLDISQNTGLTFLWCSNNQLSSLDVSQHLNLTSLRCYNNQLSSLDVSQNTNLTALYCFSNPLGNLDISQNTGLTTLQCQSNQLSSLDLSQNVNLNELYCQNNQLAGNLILSGLTVLTDFNATNNPNLLCVQVDNEADANTGTGIYTNWSIDGITSYSESCGYTAIPDANFEAALDALGYDDIPGDNQVPTANISGITNLNVSNQNIADLSGIEDFTALQVLSCFSNQLTSLDLSQNSNLTALSCQNNQLASLDVSQNINLTTLSCFFNQLTSLDLSQNTALTTLSCSINPLGSLAISQNTNLTALYCSNTQLTNLDVSQNTALITLYCDSNQLANLDLSQNTNLTDLACFNNQLTSLDLSQNTALTTLSCGNNQLVSLDVSQNINLNYLFCDNNQLSSLDLSQNSNLTDVLCDNNQLTSLEVSQNTNLTSLSCADNQLAGSLILNGLNTLTSFIAVNNPGLLCIQVDNEADANAGTGIYNGWSIDGTAGYSENCISYTAIPDPNFELALEALGYDDIPGDHHVPTANISGITTLDVSFQNIADLSGIEDFTALEILVCSYNQLTALDLSQNTNLISLDCMDNQLLSLNVSQNSNLTDLSCDSNQLTSLDLSQNSNLTDMSCMDNPNLYCIGVADAVDADAGVGIYGGWNKDATASYSESCGYTAIPDANFEAALAAYDDIPGDNQVPTASISGITDLNVNNQNIADLSGIEDFTALQALFCNNNQLSSLDLSQNANLNELYCQNNQLAGNLILSGLTVLTDFNATNNPNLLCVQVDNETDANAGAGIYVNWSIDGTASYSEDCTYTAIPDANFEAALDALGYDDIPGDNQVPTANISGVTNLNVSFQNITDLSGIEDFTALQALFCNNNQLTSLDVSQNTNLTALICSDNQLTGLDISQNTDLTELQCFNNQLSSLDVSQNTNLTTLVCANNPLGHLDISQNTNLNYLYCYNNQLTSLDVSQNTNLTQLHCFNNQLAGNLILNGLTVLTDFNATNNPNLLCVQVDNEADANTGTGIYGGWSIDGTVSFSENCNLYTAIPDANFETALVLLGYDAIPGDQQVLTASISGIIDLDVSFQNIADLSGIEDFTALQFLNCGSNQLTGLDVSQNTNLMDLDCGSNQLSSLDISQNINLTNLSCYNNQLTSLDVSQNTNLTQLRCQNNQLTGLDLSQNSNLTDMWCDNNPGLSCIEVADVADANARVGIYAGWIKDATASYSENCGGGANKGIVTDVTDQGAIEEESFVVSDIILYPNPVKDDLYIALPAERELVSVIVYNGRGEQVAESKTTGVSLTNLAAGMYFVKIELAGGARITKKVIISRN